MNEELNFSELG